MTDDGNKAIGAENDEMTLSLMLMKISREDPTLMRWAEEINKKNERANGLARKVNPVTPGADAALCSGRGSPSVQVDVAEVYSPPRVTVEASKFGLKPGSAMDLRTGYDFTKKEDRDRAWRKLEEEKPKLLVGSPECKMFSVLQNLSPWTVEKAKKFREAKMHLKFVCELYREQIRCGRLI